VTRTDRSQRDHNHVTTPAQAPHNATPDTLYAVNEGNEGGAAMMNDDTKLATLRDFYCVASQARNLSPRTIVWYREKITVFARSLPGSEDAAYVRDFSAPNVERFVSALRTQRKWAAHPFHACIE
jgi:hypothetical protein